MTVMPAHTSRPRRKARVRLVCRWDRSGYYVSAERRDWWRYGVAGRILRAAVEVVRVATVALAVVVLTAAMALAILYYM